MKRELLRLQLILLLLLAGTLTVQAQVAADDSAKLREIDAAAEKARQDWQVPGLAIAIVKNDKVIFAKGYGVRELGKSDPVDAQTLFAIASNSKAFTTALLAMLVDEKKIAWDDKVSKYLPEFQMPDAYVTRELTIRDLVSHRSGLGTFSGDLLWYESNLTTDEILSRVRLLKPVNSFRAAFGYQNLMFMAAGRVIERVTGKPWSAVVRERILDPLGMSRTTTTIRELKGNVAAPHNQLNGTMRVVHYGNVDSAAAAAGLNSCVSELAQWLRLQLGRGKFEGRQIFSPRQSWEMWQPNIFMRVSDAAMKNNPTQHFSGYGLGWFLSDYQGRRVVSHGGGLDGMISQTAMMPEENLGLVVLTNSESPVNVIMQNKIFDVMLGVPPRDWNGEFLARAKGNKEVEAAEDKRLVEARIPNTKPTLALSSYAGTYSGDLYGPVIVTEENGHLVLRMGRSPNLVADLEHWHYDTFQIHWRPSVAYAFPRGFVNFTIDQQGRTDQLKINQPNNDFWFYELELHRADSGQKP
ncbi:MAG: serine hydrolase [Blastocatellia bacterium]